MTAQAETQRDVQTIERAWQDAAISAQQVWGSPPPFAPDPRDYELGHAGMPPDQRDRLLRGLAAYLEDRRDHMLGYQVTEDMDAYQKDVSRFLTCHINNIGDPFTEGGYKVSSKIVEQAVLNYFAGLWHGTPYDPRKPDSCWGYVLSMGSTEGNMYALWSARDYLRGKRLKSDPESPLGYDDPLPVPGNPNAYRPVIFYSEDTHYSFTKAVRVLDLDTYGRLGRREYKGQNPLGGEWADEVPSELPPLTPGADDQYPTYGPGSIDVGKLVKLVDFFAGKGHPIIVSLNLGSTFKGAYDNVREVCDRLAPVFAKYDLIDREVRYPGGDGDHRRGFWIHVDGALGAGYLPFLRMASQDPAWDSALPVPVPEFDFGLRSPVPGQPPLDMVASILCSGHKWPGSPWPCGLFMTKVKYQMQPPDKPEYIGSLDTTFAGSRNGHSPIVLWDHIAQHPDGRQISLALRAQAMTQYLFDKLRKLEQEPEMEARFGKGGLYVARTPLAITVRFRRPNARIVTKWSLSTVDMYMKPGDRKTLRRYAHVFVMSSVTPDKIDAFLVDLHAPDAFDEKVAPMRPALSQAFNGQVLQAETPFADRGFA